MNDIILSNGVAIPQIGIGTWQIQYKEDLTNVFQTAYEAGYRLFDTASLYGNELGIGKVIEELALDRKSLFISDKAWNKFRGYEPVREACHKSLKRLKTDHLDLFLIHWPSTAKTDPFWEQTNSETWRGMESLYKEGLVRAIGVCNFKKHHLEALLKNSEITPMINQLELHPGMMQEETADYCRSKGIQLEASSPLGNGRILTDDVLSGIAKNKNKSVAQICIRYIIEKGIIAIPKSVHPDRIYENIRVFDFSLDEEEINSIDQLPFIGGLGLDPDELDENAQ